MQKLAKMFLVFVFSLFAFTYVAIAETKLTFELPDSTPYMPTIIDIPTILNRVVADHLSIKIATLTVSEFGIEVMVKSKVDLTPNSECKNSFLVPIEHEQYNMMAAFLLYAKSKKKRIVIEYDFNAPTCLVEMNSVTVY